MKKYIEVLKTAIKKEMVYKFDFLIFSISGIIFISVFYFLWTSIYTYNNLQTIGGLSLKEMITYMAMSVIIMFAGYSNTDRKAYWDINKNAITNILTKPLDIQNYIFSRDIADNFLSVIFSILPTLIFAVLIFNIFVPPLQTLLLFFISTILSILTSFSLAFLVWLTAFWTEQTRGIRRFKEIIIDFFAGSFLPLYLFPDWLKNIALLLPFKSISHIPLSIYIGKIHGIDIIYAITQQIFWIVVFFYIGKFLFKKARKKYSAHGG